MLQDQQFSGFIHVLKFNYSNFSKYSDTKAIKITDMLSCDTQPAQY